MAVSLETIRLLTVRAKTEGLSRMEAELAGVSRAHLDVARAADQAAKVTDTSARRQQSAASGWSKLTSEMQGSSRAAREYAQTVRLIAQAEEQGLATAKQAAQARLMSQSRLQDQVIRGPRIDQSALNFTLGIRDPATGAARASAAAFEEAAREAEALERQVANLRAQLDPLGAVQARYNAELAEYRALASSGAISSSEFAAAQGMVATRLALAEKHLGAAGGAVKLTGGQVQNLGYQINDVATMLAMGASPFQVISSQAGQVVQALGEGPGGVRGSLAAIGTTIGSLITPTGAIATGLLAAGAAALYFATKASAVKPLDEVLKNQVAIVRELRASYGLAGDAADDYARRARGAIQSDADRKTEESTTRLRQGVQEVTSQFFSGRDNSVYRESSVYAPVRQAMEDLIASAQKGPPNFIAFREKLADISKANPDKAGWYQAFTRGDLARSISDAVLPFIELQRTIESTNNVADELVRKLTSAAQVRFDDASDKLRGFVPDQMSDRDRIERAFNETRGRIAQLRGINGDGRDELEAAALRQRGLALADIERQEKIARDGRALDIREINARTTAERAAIAAARERAELSGKVMDPGEREAQIAHAAAVVYAEDARRMSEAARDRSRSYQDMISSLETEAAAFDMTRGAAMAYQRQQELIVQLYRDAADEGRIVDPTEVEEIKRVTAAAGALTDQIARLNAMRQQEEELRGLSSRAGTIGGSDDAARRAAAIYDEQRRLREENESLSSDYGKARIGNAVKLSDFGDTIRRQAEAWDDWRGAGESAIDSVVDALASGTADIGDVLKGIASDFTKTFLELAVSNPMKNALLGTSLGTIGDIFGNKPAAPSLADAGVKAFGTVAMTAAVVNLNGSPLGLGALASNAGGGTGAAGAIEKLLNPANKNSVTAAAGNGALNFVGNYKTGVDSKLTSILQEAAKISGLKVDAFSGLRPGDSRFHGKGLATDIRLFDQAGKAIPNYQNAGGFRAYEQFAQVAKQVQMDKFPELNNKFRWGGYFGGQKGKYGAMDTMHFDTGGAGMAGGTWEKGLNATQRSRFPGAESIGMADKSFKEIETKASSMASSFASTSSKLVPSLTDFVSGFDFNSNVMIDGMAGSVNDFLPKFGGNLSSLLDAVSGGGKGSGGGLLSSLISSVSGRTGISAAGVAASFANPGGKLGFFAKGGVATTASIFGEAGPEAAVPLPDGRSIPVTMHWSAMPATAAPSAATSPQIVINDMRSAGTSQPVEAKMNADGKLEVTIRDLVRSEVTQPGRKTARTLAQSGVQQPLRDVG